MSATLGQIYCDAATAITNCDEYNTHGVGDTTLTCKTCSTTPKTYLSDDETTCIDEPTVADCVTFGVNVNAVECTLCEANHYLTNPTTCADRTETNLCQEYAAPDSDDCVLCQDNDRYVND